MTDENQETDNNPLPDEDAIVDEGQTGPEEQSVDESQSAEDGGSESAESGPDSKEELIRLKVENEYLKRAPQQPPAPDYSRIREEQEEKQRLELMTPEERTQYQMQKEIRQLKTQQQQTELLQRFQMADAADRANYLERASNPDKRVAEAYSRNMGEVENRLAEYRKNGVYPTREEIHKLILGEQALAALTKGPNKQARQAAQTRVLSTQGKPIAATSQKPAAGTKKSASDMSLAELKAKAFADYKKQKGVN